MADAPDPKQGELDLKAAQDRAAAAEAQLAAAKKAQDDADAAQAKAKADAEAKAAADEAAELAKKGGEKAAKALAEANERAEKAEAALKAIREAEEQRTNELFAKLDEGTRADLEPFKNSMQPDDWAKLVQREAGKAGVTKIIAGPNTGDVGATGGKMSGTTSFKPNGKALELIEEYGPPGRDYRKTADSIQMFTERDPETGASHRKFGPGSVRALAAMMPKVQPQMMTLRSLAAREAG